MRRAGRLGDRSTCEHHATSPATTGSANVLINNRPATRTGDRIRPTDCCDGRSRAAAGAPAVLINGRAAHRTKDATTYNETRGILVSGSQNVLIGDHRCPGREHPAGIRIRIIDEREAPMPGVSATITYPDGRTRKATTDQDGVIELRDGPAGIYLVETALGRLALHSREPME